MESEDASFIHLARHHKDKAFHQLVETYSGMVYNVCLNLVLHREDAEDVTQEVFTAAYLSLESFEGKSKLSTWLYSIALNKSREFLRSKTRKKRSGTLTSLDREDTHFIPSQIVNFEHPGIQLENKERAIIYFAAVQRLPENQQLAWTLHKMEGLSYQEAAEIMETSVSSIESLIFRAKKGLREILSDYYEKNMR